MEKLSGNTSETSVRLRAQPAILYYKVRNSRTDAGKPRPEVRGTSSPDQWNTCTNPHLLRARWNGL